MVVCHMVGHTAITHPHQPTHHPQHAAQHTPSHATTSSASTSTPANAVQSKHQPAPTMKPSPSMQALSTLARAFTRKPSRKPGQHDGQRDGQDASQDASQQDGQQQPESASMTQQLPGQTQLWTHPNDGNNDENSNDKHDSIPVDTTHNYNNDNEGNTMTSVFAAAEGPPLVFSPATQPYPTTHHHPPSSSSQLSQHPFPSHVSSSTDYEHTPHDSTVMSVHDDIQAGGHSVGYAGAHDTHSSSTTTATVITAATPAAATPATTTPATTTPADVLYTYFMMGSRQHGWCHTAQWPPPTATHKSVWTLQAPNTLQAFVQPLHGVQQQSPTPPTNTPVIHHVLTGQHPRGTTRWEIMAEPARSTASLQLPAPHEGHSVFDSSPLTKDVVLVGRAVVHVLVSTSDGEGDVFCYLEDVDPVTGTVGYGWGWWGWGLCGWGHECVCVWTVYIIMQYSLYL